jgi:hypothetical protein
MLDAFIIEELKRREEERRRDERPALRIPLDEEAPPETDEDIGPEEEDDGSVIIIDYDS